MHKNSLSVAEIESLFQQWDTEANEKIGLFPDKISSGSQKKAFWLCEKHKCSYIQIVRARKRGQTGCPTCKIEQRESIDRKRYIKGKPVLATTNPELIDEWISSENPKFTPYNCVAGSNVFVTWKCKKCGGEFTTTIPNRAIRKTGCPYCAGQKVLEGYNDLQTINPDLALEWSKKNIITPKEVTSKSNKKVYWICSLGHEDYLASVKQRSNGQGCPTCAIQTHTSFPEQAIYFYVKQLFPDAINRYDYNGFELDVFIPFLATGIEYNGIYYHKNKAEHDLKKIQAMQSLGIRLIVIEECKKLNTRFITKNETLHIYLNENYNYEELSSTIRFLLNELSFNNDLLVNCEKDRIAINEQYINSVKNNSILEKSPTIAQEWDNKKNGKIKPMFVSFGSSQKFYWNCPVCGYSYLASPKSRLRGTSCPCCSGKIVVNGINDLRTKYPSIAQEWDYNLNKGVLPEQISFGSGKKVWWKCNKGHKWQASVNRRTSNNNGCPYCSGRLAIKGINDLSTTNPELISEWDYDKNNISPDEVKTNSNKSVWWKCTANHSYKASINSRSSGGGCPYCSNQRVLKGYNDLLTTNYDLALEWDYFKNTSIKPTDVVQGSHKKVWWKCPVCGYSWKVSISNRNGHTGCPKCHHKYWIKQ